MKYMFPKILTILCLLTIISFTQPSITWQRLYNGPANKDEGGNAICPADDGNFFIAGYTTLDTLPTRRVYVLKINPLGDTIWARIILINGTSGGAVNAILATNNGGCVLTQVMRVINT
jgi:hypothetical protein